MTLLLLLQTQKRSEASGESPGTERGRSERWRAECAAAGTDWIHRSAEEGPPEPTVSVLPVQVCCAEVPLLSSGGQCGAAG